MLLCTATAICGQVLSKQVAHWLHSCWKWHPPPACPAVTCLSSVQKTANSTCSHQVPSCQIWTLTLLHKHGMVSSNGKATTTLQCLLRVAFFHTRLSCIWLAMTLILIRAHGQLFGSCTQADLGLQVNLLVCIPWVAAPFRGIE